jgi:hypothetical protein
METSVSDTKTSASAPLPRRDPDSRRLLLAFCVTALLSAFLCALELRSSAAWRFESFQTISIIFFALVATRHLAEPTRAENMNLVPAALNAKRGLLFVLATTIFAYAATIPLYFTCDDFEHLSLARHPFMDAIWPEITKGQFDGVVYIFYRPLGFASLFLDFRLWHYWAPGYHLTNLLLHLLGVGAVFYFCRQLQLRDESCVAAALIFAVLPVNVQAVTWIGCRFDQLATALGMWSLAFAAGFRRTGKADSYGMAILLFVLAVLSKESAYVVPVLWLALELIPQDEFPLQAPFTKRSEPLLGYVLAPLLMLLHRLHTLGGVAGYRSMKDGSPLVQSWPLSSLVGVLVRAPGETLFGYNWLQHGLIYVLAAGAVASILLMLGLLAKPSLASRRIVWFCLIWVYVAGVPAHFYFRSAEFGLYSSRALYFGSIGIAVLIAVLLGQTFTCPKVYIRWACALSLLLIVGVEHNIGAWRIASQKSQTVQSVLEGLHPSPPPRAIYFIRGVPQTINGVPFFTVGLENAVRFHYSWRDDIHVRTRESKIIEPTAIPVDMTSSFAEEKSQ